MKRLLAAAAFAALSPTLAAAATVQVPATGKPLATVSLPEGWTHKVSDDDIEASPSDEGVVVILSTNPKQMTEADMMKEAKDALGSDIEIVPGSMKSSKDTVNGNAATVTHIDLKSKGGSGTVDLTITQIATKSTAVIVVGIAGTPEDEKKHEAEVEAIFKSLKINE